MGGSSEFRPMNGAPFQHDLQATHEVVRHENLKPGKRADASFDLSSLHPVALTREQFTGDAPANQWLAREQRAPWCYERL